jgi:Mg2+/Co2+ transporter CorB
MTLNRYRLRHLVKLKHASATKALKLLQRPDRLLGLILLCNTFSMNFAASIATVITIRLYADEESKRCHCNRINHHCDAYFF